MSQQEKQLTKLANGSEKYSSLDSGDPVAVSESVPKYTAFTPNRVKFILFLVTIAGFLGPVSGNIYIPILPQLQAAFKVSATTINATVSVFMAVFALAPLFWASWADFGGRKTLYLVSLIIYIVANILLAAVPANIGALFFLRILQAFGVSSVMSVGAGTVADVVEPKNRAKAISYFMLGPQLGPILGPILSLISSNGDWRWIFGFLAILGAIVFFLILFCLPETLRYLVGDGQIYSQGYFVIPRLVQKKVIEESPKFPRPPKPSFKTYWNVVSYFPVLLCSMMGGLLFSSFYAQSITFSRVLQNQYHFTSLQASLSYICPGISLVCGSLSGGRISDNLRQYLKKKNPDSYLPESRLSLQAFGIALSMAGILGYGWCVDHKVHVVAVFVFTFLIGFGMTWVFVSNTTYLTECSAGQPATYVAVGNLMRNAAAAISSAIIERLIKKMGFGWCFTGLAIVDLLCVGLTILILCRGEAWRRKRESNLTRV